MRGWLPRIRRIGAATAATHRVWIAGLCIVALPVANLTLAHPALAATRIAAVEPASEEHIVAGEIALSEARFDDAGLSFEAGYSALSARERRGELGEHLVSEAVSAYEQAHQKSRDAQLLYRALRLLRTHEEEHGGSLPSPELRAELERLTAIVDKLEVEPPAVGPQLPPSDDPVGSSPDEPTPESAGSAGRPPLDRVAIGLLAGGSVAAVGGLSLIIWGSQVPRLAQGALDERGGSASGDADFLDRAGRIQGGALAGGAVALGAGLGLITWGVVRLVRKRRKR